MKRRATLLPARRKLLATAALSCVAVPDRWAVAAGTEEQRAVGQRFIRPLQPPVDLSLTDPSTGRKIGLRIRLPGDRSPAGLIIYSPGLGSGLSNGADWCEAWCRSGYVVATLSHPVTNDSIWNTGKQSFKANLGDALAPAQYGLRVKDCSFVITHCLTHPDIAPAVDPDRIGIAGHSYGALTVQSIAGQPLGSRDMRDSRIKAAIALSPGAVSVERAKGMSRVSIPFFSITGDHDNFVTLSENGESMRLGMPLANRLLVHEYVTAAHKKLVVFEQADHMSFAGEPVNPGRFSRDLKKITDQSEQELWSRVSETTTAFWNEHL